MKKCKSGGFEVKKYGVYLGTYKTKAEAISLSQQADAAAKQGMIEEFFGSIV